MQKTALVFAGGGSRGAYEMGVWKAIIELDIPIHIVCGTSIGAINGAMVAQGDFEEAQKMWDTVQTSEVFAVPVNDDENMKEKVKKTYGAFAKDLFHGGTDTSPLKVTLEKYFDEKKIRESKIAYGLVTVEKETMKPWEMFVENIPQGKLVDFVLASASIYPAVRPYTIDGIDFIDGTYYDNLPVSMALEKGAEKIIAVDLGAFGKVNRELIDSLENLVYIKSYWDLGLTLVFDRDNIKKIQRYGYLDAMKAFGVFDGYAYSFVKNSSIEIDKDFKREGRLAKKLGISSGKLRYSISDKVISSKWRKIIKDRNSRKETQISDFLLSAELAAEILNIDPAKIYTIEIMSERIQEELGKIEASPMDRETKGAKRVKNIIGALAMVDKKKRFKNIAVELSYLFENEEEIAATRLASLYTEEFFAALYVAIKGLV
ncbi:MAG: patatin-like phospholipase family protein [Proteocatella sp.]